jgi:hypothetical protein
MNYTASCGGVTKNITNGYFSFNPTGGSCDLSFDGGDVAAKRTRQSASGNVNVYAFDKMDAADMDFIKSFVGPNGSATGMNLMYRPNVPITLYFIKPGFTDADKTAAKKAVDTFNEIWSGLRSIGFQEFDSEPDNLPEGSILAKYWTGLGDDSGIYRDPADSNVIFRGDINAPTGAHYLYWMHFIGHTIAVVHTPNTFMEQGDN